MSHKNIIIDCDTRFRIDGITREITNTTSPAKNKIVQYDHNSERIGFVMPRFIEGHDMMDCNRVEIHYKNIDSGSREEITGVYGVDDMDIDSVDDSLVNFSWLISQNATQKVGILSFLLRFSCVSEEGIIEYAWHTAKFQGIYVSEGMYNSEEIIAQYADVLEQWKKELSDNIFEVNFERKVFDDGEPGTIAPLPMILCDKTNEEIINAIDEGKQILGKLCYEGDYWLTSSLYDVDIRRYGFDIEGNYKEMRVVTVYFYNSSCVYKVCFYDPNMYGSSDTSPHIREYALATQTYVDNAIGNIETVLENIITKYGLGGDAQ